MDGQLPMFLESSQATDTAHKEASQQGEGEVGENRTPLRWDSGLLPIPGPKDLH